MNEYSAVVPAQPGWYVCDPTHGDDGISGLSESAVVAWIITYTRENLGVGGAKTIPVPDLATPVTADGLGGDQNPLILKRPDGTYTDPYNRDYTNEGEVVADLRKRAEAVRPYRSGNQ